MSGTLNVAGCDYAKEDQLWDAWRAAVDAFYAPYGDQPRRVALSDRSPEALTRYDTIDAPFNIYTKFAAANRKREALYCDQLSKEQLSDLYKSHCDNHPPYGAQIPTRNAAWERWNAQGTVIENAVEAFSKARAS